MKDARLLHREAADQFRTDVMGIANADDAKSRAKRTTDYKKAVTNVLGDLKRATAELTKAHKAFNHNLAAEAEKVSSRRAKLLAGKIKSDANSVGILLEGVKNTLAFSGQSHGYHVNGVVFGASPAHSGSPQF